MNLNQQWASLVIGALSAGLERDAIWEGDEDANFAANQVIQDLIRQLSEFIDIVALEFVRFEHRTGVNGDGGTSVNVTWNLRPLTTIQIDTTAAATLAANIATLPPGRWLVQVESTVFRSEENQMRVKNSVGTVIAVCSVQANNTNANNSSTSTAIFLIDTADDHSFYIEHYTRIGITTRGLGDGYTFGEVGVFAAANCLKIAD